MTSTPRLDEDVKYQLGAISGKLDLILVQNAESDRRHTARMDGIDKVLNEHEDRIISLEHNRSWVLGIGAAVAAAFGALGTYAGFR